MSVFPAGCVYRNIAKRFPWALPAFAAAALMISAATQVPDMALAQERAALRRVIPDEPLRRPVALAPLPDGQRELAVVEQEGLILRFSPQARRASGVLLDWRRLVSRSGNEEGLLSVAFHPHFDQHPLLYVYYSSSEGPRHTVVARFAYDPARRAADPASHRVLLQIPQPYSNHKGGQMAFGPDGMLTIGLGDGGSGGDPHGNGQNRRTLLGKILRIDVDHPQGGLAYGIPEDNPFRGATDGSRPEIWAFGLRNPWRFSFDRATGDLYAADVGQDEVEEVDLIRKGGNYGWNIMEGSQCFLPSSGCSRTGLELPIAEYTHREGISITGGYVYRGQALPGLRGKYVFGDYGSGTVWTIPTAGPAAASSKADTLRPRTVLLQSRLALASFGEDEAGELYLLDLAGGVYRLEPAP